MLEIEAPKPSLKHIPVVQDFSYVFSKEIPSMPPPREVEFCIDFVPGATPISKTPYIMDPVKFKELKTLLDKLLEKGYIRPSTSPWGPRTLCKEEGWDLEVVHRL